MPLQMACALCTPFLPINATGLCKELIPGWSTNNVMDGKRNPANTLCQFMRSKEWLACERRQGGHGHEKV